MQKFYSDRVQQFNTEVEKHRKALVLLGAFRLFVFIASIVFVSLFWDSNRTIGWGLFVVGISIFLFLLKKFESIKWKRDYATILSEINAQEIKGLNNDYSEFSTGVEFENNLHEYAPDLDIFGNKGLYPTICRAELPNGKQQLAERLLNLFTDKEILTKRQAAIQELENKLEYRQKQQALNRMTAKNKESLTYLIDWAQNEEGVNVKTWVKIALVVVPIIMFSATGLVIIDVLTFNDFMWFLILPFTVAMGHVKNINAQYLQLSKAVDSVINLELSLSLLENESFDNELTIAIQKDLEKNGKASESIAKLKSILRQFDQRNNMLVGIILNAYLLWDLKIALKLEKWKTQHASSIPIWLKSIAQIEELSSFANYKFNNKTFTFPIFTENNEIKIKDAGHPLINSEECVTNDFNISLNQNFVILTGANMAGKSTFLRTLGVNMVLAQAGSVVCASKMEIQPIMLHSGMRTSDSLSEHTSYFHAELKRLQTIIQSLEKGNKLFILLDEILKGTNSKDKEEGSRKLIEKLLKLNASGVIATHDLGLCTLEKVHPEHIKNMAFDTQIEADDLSFDYKLKHGICQTMNASFLLNKMGITS